MTVAQLIAFAVLYLAVVAVGLVVTLAAIGVGLRLLDPSLRATPYVSLAILLAGVVGTTAVSTAAVEPIAHLVGAP